MYWKLFEDTPDFHNKINIINDSAKSDQITIKLLNNEGGPIGMGYKLLQAIVNSRANIHVIAVDFVGSTAAFIWMRIYIEKLKYPLENIKLSLENHKTMFVYHRPRKIINGEVFFLEHIKDEEEWLLFKEDVYRFDKCLADFLHKNPNILLSLDGDNIAKETHSDIFDLYTGNSDIYIPIGGVNEIYPYA